MAFPTTLTQAQDRNAVAGTCNTNGTAVTRVSGNNFTSITCGYIEIGNSPGTLYAIASITDANNLVLATSAGVQTGAYWTAALDIVAAHLNALEAKVGIDGSTVVTSLDYLLKNPASIDPGHKHSKLWASDGNPEAVTVDAAGNVGMLSKLQISSPNVTISGDLRPTQLFLASTSVQAADMGAMISLGGENGGSTTPYVFGTIAGRKYNSNSTDYAGYLQFGTTDINSALTEWMRITSDGKVGMNTPSPVISGTGKLHLAADTFRLDTDRTPASAGAAGNAGEICGDVNYIYRCVATNTWKRAALSTW